VHRAVRCWRQPAAAPHVSGPRCSPPVSRVPHAAGDSALPAGNAAAALHALARAGPGRLPALDWGALCERLLRVHPPAAPAAPAAGAPRAAHPACAARSPCCLAAARVCRTRVGTGRDGARTWRAGGRPPPPPRTRGGRGAGAGAAGAMRGACVALALRHGGAPALRLGELLDGLLQPGRCAALEPPLRAALLAGLPRALGALAPARGAALLRALPALSGGPTCTGLDPEQPGAGLPAPGSLAQSNALAGGSGRATDRPSGARLRHAAEADAARVRVAAWEGLRGFWAGQAAPQGGGSGGSGGSAGAAYGGSETPTLAAVALEATAALLRELPRPPEVMPGEEDLEEGHGEAAEEAGGGTAAEAPGMHGAAACGLGPAALVWAAALRCLAALPAEQARPRRTRLSAQQPGSAACGMRCMYQVNFCITGRHAHAFAAAIALLPATGQRPAAQL
jgi:hypothetical protein